MLHIFNVIAGIGSETRKRILRYMADIANTRLSENLPFQYNESRGVPKWKPATYIRRKRTLYVQVREYKFN